IKANGFGEIGNGGVVISSKSIGLSSVDQSQEISGIQSKSFGKIGNGPTEASLVEIGQAPVEGVHGVGRLRFRRRRLRRQSRQPLHQQGKVFGATGDRSGRATS